MGARFRFGRLSFFTPGVLARYLCAVHRACRTVARNYCSSLPDELDDIRLLKVALVMDREVHNFNSESFPTESAVQAVTSTV